MLASVFEVAVALLGVLTPLVAVPLTVITFYLKSLREHQVSRHTELSRRVEGLEQRSAELRTLIREFERDFTTKEEWLRECMQARRMLEQVTGTTVRIEATMQTLLRTAGATSLLRPETERDRLTDAKAGMPSGERGEELE